jgi:hypothetical protein
MGINCFRLRFCGPRFLLPAALLVLLPLLLPVPLPLVLSPRFSDDGPFWYGE